MFGSVLVDVNCIQGLAVESEVPWTRFHRRKLLCVHQNCILKCIDVLDVALFVRSLVLVCGGQLLSVATALGIQKV